MILIMFKNKEYYFKGDTGVTRLLLMCLFGKMNPEQYKKEIT